MLILGVSTLGMPALLYPLVNINVCMLFKSGEDHQWLLMIWMKVKDVQVLAENLLLSVSSAFGFHKRSSAFNSRWFIIAPPGEALPSGHRCDRAESWLLSIDQGLSQKSSYSGRLPHSQPFISEDEGFSWQVFLQPYKHLWFLGSWGWGSGEHPSSKGLSCSWPLFLFSQKALGDLFRAWAILAMELLLPIHLILF